jgi:hyperosmotically inducible protein
MNSSKLGSLILALGLAGAAPVFVACSTNKPVSTQVSDSSITASVKAKLMADDDVKGHNVDVNTEEGVVYLLGRVDTEAEKAEAERLARSVDGVEKVVNHLKVGA